MPRIPLNILTRALTQAHKRALVISPLRETAVAALGHLAPLAEYDSLPQQSPSGLSVAAQQKENYRTLPLIGLGSHVAAPEPVSDLVSRTIKLMQRKSLSPELPVLNSLVAKLKASGTNFGNTVFVCGQHLLGTTVELFKAMIALGAKPENIFVVGKSYSNNPEVIKALEELGIYVQPTTQQDGLANFIDAYNQDINDMWAQSRAQILKTKRVTILDDGGHVLAYVPSNIRNIPGVRIVSSEQTSSGMRAAQVAPRPAISLATSAIKALEAPWVAELIAEKLLNTLSGIRTSSSKFFPNGIDPKDISIGIVGLGQIGKGVFDALRAAGYKKFVLLDTDRLKTQRLEDQNIKDNSPVQISPVDNLSEVVLGADVIIGCTGKDITAGNLSAFKVMKTPIVLISTSSKNSEFLNLLEHYYTLTRRSGKMVDPLATFEFQNGFGAAIRVENGGFPVNFDNSIHSVPPEKIQLIRAALLAACAQAEVLLNDANPRAETYMLDPVMQYTILQDFLGLQPKEYSDAVKAKLPNIESIKANSGGIVYPISPLSAKQIQEVPQSELEPKQTRPRPPMSFALRSGSA